MHTKRMDLSSKSSEIHMRASDERALCLHLDALSTFERAGLLRGPFAVPVTTGAAATLCGPRPPDWTALF